MIQIHMYIYIYIYISLKKFRGVSFAFFSRYWNSPQRSSSEPSKQSLTPSHSGFTLLTHFPLAHLYEDEEQPLRSNEDNGHNKAVKRGVALKVQRYALKCTSLISQCNICALTRSGAVEFITAVFAVNHPVTH